MQRIISHELMPLANANVTSPTTPCILINANNERYINTPGIIGITEGIVRTWFGTLNQCTAFTANKLTTKLPINVALSGGTYKGQYALYEENQQQNEPEAIKKISISVTGGVYEGNIGSQDVTGFISGGKFAQLPNEDCMSPDYVAQMGGDGYYAPVESTVLRGAQKNAQADIREYAAMLGMRWLDILTAAENTTHMSRRVFRPDRSARRALNPSRRR